MRLGLESRCYSPSPIRGCAPDRPEPVNDKKENQERTSDDEPQVWTADLSYVPTLDEGWLYFAAEMDLCSKRIAGWNLDDSLAAPLAVEAFQRAT